MGAQSASLAPVRRVRLAEAAKAAGYTALRGAVHHREELVRGEQARDDSKPGVRLLVLSAMLFAGRDSGLLSFEALKTSPASLIYAIALAAATVATLAAMTRSARSATTPEALLPRTGPTWHESTLFTDPWYQVPAIYCVLMLFCRFVLDLVATPPTTERAVWFLAGLASLAAAFGLVGADASRKRPKKLEADPPVLDGELDVGTRGAALDPQYPLDPFMIGDKAAEPTENGSVVRTALRDPWSTAPAAAVAFLHIARDGLETIEEDPESLLATVWLLLPAAFLAMSLVTTTVSQTRQRRKDMKEQEEAGTRRYTGEPASETGTTRTSSGTVTGP